MPDRAIALSDEAETDDDRLHARQVHVRARVAMWRGGQTTRGILSFWQPATSRASLPWMLRRCCSMRAPPHRCLATAPARSTLRGRHANL
jgi:hypothetical protein